MKNKNESLKNLNKKEFKKNIQLLISNSYSNNSKDLTNTESNQRKKELHKLFRFFKCLKIISALHSKKKSKVTNR